jgi:hypothetical protein
VSENKLKSPILLATIRPIRVQYVGTPFPDDSVVDGDTWKANAESSWENEGGRQLCIDEFSLGKRVLR